MRKLLILISLYSVGIMLLPAQSEIQRVEPPNWWTGMHHSALQLLVYGSDLGELMPEIEYAGVKLKNVIRVENPNYLFLNLEIDPKTKPGEFDILFKKGDQTVLSHTYSLWERREGSAQKEGFNSSDVMYLITPDRFANGNPENDNVAGMKEEADRSNGGGRHGGDLAGVSQHLDYIVDMGFTAIWLNPVLENDMSRYSYHGYSTTDYYKVDPRYGSNESYRKLSQDAKAKGIKMIMDQILNHCGSEHWWMKDPPSSDWIHMWEGRENGFKGTNHRRTTLQDPYAAPSDRKWFQDGWFVPTMPDLNQRNPQMAEYLIQNSIWWVEYADLGGIRMDTYSYPERDFMGVWTERIMKEYPNFSVVGEEWFSSPVIISYWQNGKETHDGFHSELSSLMDFPVQIRLIEALREEESWNSGWIRLYELISQDYIYPNPYDLVIFADNHDMSRVFTQLDENFNHFQNTMAFLMTMRGIPQIFYGTEILMKHPGSKRHEDIRSDFPGGWDGDKVNAFSGDGLTKQEKEAQEMMRKLLHWRKAHPVIHSGKLMHYGPLHDGIYVYFRYNKEEKVMVVLNKNEEDFTLDLSRFTDMLNGTENGKDIFSGESYQLRSQLIIPAGKPMVLEIN